MKTKKYILIGIIFFLLASLLFVIYHGRKVEYILLFEGEISSINDSSLTIQGFPQNDAGMRGQYIITKNDSISINDSNGNRIDFSSLAVGDHLEIRYMDHIAKSKVEQYGLKDGKEIPNVQQIDVIE